MSLEKAKQNRVMRGGSVYAFLPRVAHFQRAGFLPFFAGRRLASVACPTLTDCAQLGLVLTSKNKKAASCRSLGDFKHTTP